MSEPSLLWRMGFMNNEVIHWENSTIVILGVVSARK